MDVLELFLYKALEYLDFGPKTQFLIRKHSQWSLTDGASLTYIAFGNYIMTDSVPIITDTIVKGEGSEKKQEPNQQELFESFLSSSRVEDAVELSSAILVKNLLSLGDTFVANGENYGIYKQDEDFKFMFIDHLPGANGILSKITREDQLQDFSPRRNYREEIANEAGRRDIGDISETNFNLKGVDLSIKQHRHQMVAKKVNERVFGPKSFQEENEGKSKFQIAIDKAQRDISTLIESYENNFITPSSLEGAEIPPQQVLSGFVMSINEKLANYQATAYSRQR